MNLEGKIMKKAIINPPKPSKAELVYIQQLAKRPSGLIFREVFSNVRNRIVGPGTMQ